MGSLHIHVTALEGGRPASVFCKHIPRARVSVAGVVGLIGGPVAESKLTDANGVANFDLGLRTGPFFLTVSVATPKGRTASHTFTGVFYTPIYDATWDMGVEGAADECDPWADLWALWDGPGLFFLKAGETIVLGAVGVAAFVYRDQIWGTAKPQLEKVMPRA